MKNTVYNSALQIINVLESNGYPAYIVGGAVRDYYLELCSKKISLEASLNRAPDIDIASSARPEEVRQIFDRTIVTGLKFGTVTILNGDHSFEHTTFRKDLFYPEDSRKPLISFSDTLKEDVSRRDFTMNALALDSSGNIIDYFGGKEDIESSIIRCVGNPEERLKEDPLRKLRAVRFAAQKNLSLDPRLMDAIKKSPDLSVVSPERIRVEMDKILISENPSKGIDLMLKIGLLEEIIPELIPSVGFDQMSKHHEFSVYKHILSVVSKLPPDKNLRWAGLFHDIAKPICFFIGDDGHGHFTGHEEEGAEIADSIMRRLKFSNEDRTKIRNIVYLHGRYPVLKKRPVRKWMAKLISKYSMNPIELVSFFEADYGGKRTEPLKTNYFDKLKKLMDEIKSEENVFSRGDLKVSGKDLISDLNLREEEYRNLGFIFDQLLDACISQPELNEKQILIDMARDILKNKI